jgi:hypothetical protein
MTTHRENAEDALHGGSMPVLLRGILHGVLAVVDKLDEQPKEGVRLWIDDGQAAMAAEEHRLDQVYGTEDSPEQEPDYLVRLPRRPDDRLKAARRRTHTPAQDVRETVQTFRETSFNRGVEAAAADLKQRLADWVRNEPDDNHVILKIYEWIASMEKKDE